nr:hypothetical protein [Tanacetum cinerariifolium]
FQGDHQFKESMVQQVLNQIIKDLLVIVKKLLMLEMIVDESLEMIKDESHEMIEDESLNIIVDETLDMLVDEFMDETLKLDGEHLQTIIVDCKLSHSC